MRSNFSRLSMIAPRTGKTTALAQAAKQIKGTLIVHSEEEARRVSNEFGIKAVSMYRNLIGTKGPYLVDTHAVSMFAHEMEAEFNRVRIEAYEDAIAYMGEKLKELKRRGRG